MHSEVGGNVCAAVADLGHGHIGEGPSFNALAEPLSVEVHQHLLLLSRQLVPVCLLVHLGQNVLQAVGNTIEFLIGGNHIHVVGIRHDHRGVGAIHIHSDIGVCVDLHFTALGIILAAILHNVIDKVVKMPGEVEDYTAYGDVLMSGVKLKSAFCGTGYDENTRFFKDFESRIYFMEEIK